MVPYEAFLAEKPVVTTTDAGGPLEVVAGPANGSRVRAARSRARRSVFLAARPRRRREGLGPRGQGDRAARVVGRDDRAFAGVRVAYYSPLPPERSGIADYSALLLPALRRLVEVEVVRRGRTRPVAADVALYHVGQRSRGAQLDRRRAAATPRCRRAARVRAAPSRRGPDYRPQGRAGLSRGDGARRGRRRPAARARSAGRPRPAAVGDAPGGVSARGRGALVRDCADRPLALRRGARARAAFDGPVWRIPHPAWPHAGRCACRRRRAAAVRLLRAPQREQAHPAAARGVRSRAPPASATRSSCSSVRRRRASTRSGSSATVSSASTTWTKDVCGR